YFYTRYLTSNQKNERFYHRQSKALVYFTNYWNIVCQTRCAGVLYTYYLAYKLDIDSGIEMAECRIEKIAGKHHTFFTKRFDRDKTARIHFASAMTMTSKNEEIIKDEMPSYLDIVEFIQFSGTHVVHDLHQLWKRIVFNIL